MSLGLSVYSKYRTQLMGLAAIMIILCHIRGIDSTSIPLLEKLLWFGNYGVEIFLFVSGIGMYYSLTKGNKSLMQWYKRRYVRISIPFILIAVSIYPLRLILNIPANVSDFLLYITTLEFWIHHRGAWYVAMLFPLYFVTPYIVKIISAYKTKILIVSVLIMPLLGFSYIPTENEIIQNIQFVTSRVPIFILGIGIAPYVKTDIE
jgi:peptidoglycan/LPS O-acetylase OafA/YrhL